LAPPTGFLPKGDDNEYQEFAEISAGRHSYRHEYRDRLWPRHHTAKTVQLAGENEELHVASSDRKVRTNHIRIEVEFPVALIVSSFDSKPEWRIEEKKGRIRKTHRCNP